MGAWFRSSLVLFRSLMTVAAVLAFSLHGAAMAGYTGHSCLEHGLHQSGFAQKAVSHVEHGSPLSAPCCASACTLLLMPLTPGAGTFPRIQRIAIAAAPVYKGVHPDGPRRPPR